MEVHLHVILRCQPVEELQPLRGLFEELSQFMSNLQRAPQEDILAGAVLESQVEEVIGAVDVSRSRLHLGYPGLDPLYAP